MIKTATLRSGLVIAGAYADKLRRVMFAQLRNDVKEGKIKTGDIAYAVAQLNRVLYRVFVDNLKIDKGDAVRITIDYEVKDSSINWDWNSLRIEVFKRIPDEEVEGAIKPVLQEVEEIVKGAVEYSVEKLGETEDGDLIYVLKLGDNTVGAFEVVPINNELIYVKKGAATDPSPMIIERVKVGAEGDIDSSLKKNIGVFTSKARYVDRAEAEELINYITGRIKRSTKS